MSKRYLLLFAVLILGGTWGVHAWLFVDLPSLETLPEQLAVPSSHILDRDGRLLYEIIDPNGGGHTPVPLSQIPAACREATIAVEDVNYYSHPGVDLTGIARALWVNLQGGETLAGGSTITQQVAKNLLLDPEEAAERTLTRKLRESILAWRLAQSYSKDDVLELYLNQTFYGNLAYGMEAAAQAFFGKPAAALDLAECAMLAGLPQAPALFDPLTNPAAAQEKQALVLDLMVKRGDITPEEAKRAKQELLAYAATPFPINAPHFVSYVWSRLELRLGADVVRAGGLVVTTTLDLELQQAAESILRRHLARLQTPLAGRPPRNVHNGGLAALDPHSGDVLVMVGSPDYFDAGIAGAVNAALAPRQPGSALKPFTYAAAFTPNQLRPWTPATVLLDVRTAFPTREGDPYVPLNYDRTFHGPVPIRQALASSYNIPAVKTLQHVGLDALVKLMRDLGVSTFEQPGRFGLALTLGGGEVRLLELTAAYAALANGGTRVEPIIIRKITNLQSPTSNFQLPTSNLQPPILDPRVAWLVTDILSDDAARAPSFGRGSVLRLSRPAAVKTGTTTDWRDNWTVGYTPDLVAGVWVGNADNSPMEQVSGVTGAGPIWHDFMETALLGRPELAFVRPEGLVQAEVCAISGKLPTALCPHRSTEWFIQGTVPAELDDWCQRFQLDKASGLLAAENAPAERVVERVYLVLPPELRDWAREQGIPSPPPAASAITGGVGESAAPLVITSPDNGVVYRLSTALPAEQQRIRLAAVAHVPLAQVTFVMDDQLVAVASRSYEVFWTLRPGRRRLIAIGRTADGREVRSEPVDFEVVGELVRPLGE